MAATTTNKRVTEAAVACLVAAWGTRRTAGGLGGDPALNEAGSSFANLDRGRGDDE